jgi:hypothetical protein
MFDDNLFLLMACYVTGTKGFSFLYFKSDYKYYSIYPPIHMHTIFTISH